MNASIINTDRGLALDVTIRLPKGLHSRPSAKLAQIARQFDADIHLLASDGEVDAKSMLDVLSLALQMNDSVRILAKGPQAPEALREIGNFLTSPES